MLRHQLRRLDSRPTTRYFTRPPATTGDLGDSACATRSRSRSSPAPAAMFINDVGQNTWEEIDDGIAGANYGWPQRRARRRRPASPSTAVLLRSRQRPVPRLRDHRRRLLQPGRSPVPIDVYGQLFLRRLLRRLDQPARPGHRLHLGDRLCLRADLAGRPASRTRGQPLLPRPRRRSDERNGRSHQLDRQPGTNDHPAAAEHHRFSRRAGQLHRRCLRHGAAELPVAAQRLAHPRRNVADLHAGGGRHLDNGAQFRAVVTNGFGTATSNAATLTVVSNTAPTGTITSPTNGSFYSAGQTITYSATGTDTQDGTLPASAFTWQVDFHHNDTPAHVHPFIQPSPARRAARSSSRTPARRRPTCSTGST